MFGLARAKATRERARMGLITIIAFEIRAEKKGRHCWDEVGRPHLYLYPRYLLYITLQERSTMYAGAGQSTSILSTIYSAPAPLLGRFARRIVWESVHDVIESSIHG